MTETDQEHVTDTEPAMAQAQGSSLGANGTLESEDQGETEDEEVKRNCMFGVRDSDFSDTDMDGEEEDEEQDQAQNQDTRNDPMEEEDKEHLVQFVSGGKLTKPDGILYRPTPIAPKLATHQEESDEGASSSSESEEEEEECLSDNARGASFSYMDNGNDDDASSESSEASDDDDDEAQEIEEAVIQEEEALFQSDSVEESSDEEESDQDDSSVEEEIEMDEAAVATGNGGSDQPKDEAGEEDDDDLVIELSVGEPMAVSDEETREDIVVDDDHAEQDDDEDSSALIGASVDDRWTWSKQKRVLSSNTLAALNLEAGIDPDPPKRMRSYSYPPPVTTEPPAMPDLSLGAAAFDAIQILPRHSLMRDGSPELSSDEEEDRMLSEELEDKLGDTGGDNSPIPLLTPPQSPRREDEVEWPSNLVVDSALMNSVTEIRPLSPASLQDLEAGEEQRLKSQDIEASTLTPILRSICVGMR